MKKSNHLFLGLVSLMLLGACTTRDAAYQEDQQFAYPANPANGTVYTDPYGNQSVWNSAMNYWIISSMLNGHRVNHYYYPSTGVYRDNTMRIITRSDYGAYARRANPSRVYHSVPVRSGSWGSRSASSPARSGGFGSSGRSFGGSSAS